MRGYVTFNTVVFDHEIEEAARTIAQIVEAGADALIVQDVNRAGIALATFGWLRRCNDGHVL